jgi:hypothetical protein
VTGTLAAMTSCAPLAGVVNAKFSVLIDTVSLAVTGVAGVPLMVVASAVADRVSVSLALRLVAAAVKVAVPVDPVNT